MAKKNEFGQKMKAARLAAGLTQKQVGDALGYDGRSGMVTISLIENNDDHKVRLTPKRWLALAKVLGISLDEVRSWFLGSGACCPTCGRS